MSEDIGRYFPRHEGEGQIDHYRRVEDAEKVSREAGHLYRNYGNRHRAAKEAQGRAQVALNLGTLIRDTGVYDAMRAGLEKVVAENPDALGVEGTRAAIKEMEESDVLGNPYWLDREKQADKMYEHEARAKAAVTDGREHYKENEALYQTIAAGEAREDLAKKGAHLDFEMSPREQANFIADTIEADQARQAAAETDAQKPQ